jgi:hypothetical protein
MALNLVEYERLKDLLGLTGGEISEYPELPIIISRIESAFQGYMGRDLERAEDLSEEIYITFPGSMLKLRRIPVVSVSSMTIVDSLGNSEEVSSDYYVISPWGVQLSFLGYPASRATVVYTGGYLDDEMPQGIKDAAIIQAAYEYQNKDYIGAKMIRGEGGSVEIPSLQLLPEVKRMIGEYIHPLKKAVFG